MRHSEITLGETFGYEAEPASPEHVEQLGRILRILDKNPNVQPFRDRIIIFGGVGRGSIREFSDLDIMLDLHDQDHGVGFMYYPEIDGIAIFLGIALKFYGWVDVFIKTKRWMAVRSDDAHHWIRAKGARMLWKAAQTEGKSLDEVLQNWPRARMDAGIGRKPTTPPPEEQ